MLAAAHVNWHFLLILLLPSVVACIVVALTWYSRAKRRGAPSAQPPRSSAAKPGRSPGAQPSRPPIAKPGRSSSPKSARPSSAKRRPK